MPEHGVIATVWEDILGERHRQKKLYPQDKDPETWLAVLAGELGEVADEVLKGSAFDSFDAEKYREELTQLVAVGIGALENLYFRQRRHQDREERREKNS